MTESHLDFYVVIVPERWAFVSSWVNMARLFFIYREKCVSSEVLYTV